MLSLNWTDGAEHWLDYLTRISVSQSKQLEQTRPRGAPSWLLERFREVCGAQTRPLATLHLHLHLHQWSCHSHTAWTLNIIWFLNGSPQPLLPSYQGEIEEEEKEEGEGEGGGGLKFKISSSRSSLQFIFLIPQLPSCQWYLDAIFQNKRNYCPKLKLFLEPFSCFGVEIIIVVGRHVTFIIILLFYHWLRLYLKVFRITKCKQVFHEFVVEQQAKFQSWRGSQ